MVTCPNLKLHNLGEVVEHSQNSLIFHSATRLSHRDYIGSYTRVSMKHTGNSGMGDRTSNYNYNSIAQFQYHFHQARKKRRPRTEVHKTGNHDYKHNPISPHRLQDVFNSNVVVLSSGSKDGFLRLSNMYMRIDICTALFFKVRRDQVFS